MQPGSVILSWGPPRMGTTWLFNVLRDMATTAGEPVGIVADQVEPPSSGWDGPVLIKSHRADPPALTDQFATTNPLLACVMVRDSRSTFRSLVRTQTADRSELIDWLERDLESYETVLPTMQHVAVIREEWVAGQAADVVQRLAEFLDLRLTSEQSADIATQFDRRAVREFVDQLDQQSDWSGDFRNFDRASQWHAGHIAPDDQPEVVLTDEETRRLDQIQSRVAALAATYPLWSAVNANATTWAGTVPAMDYVRARAVQLGPAHAGPVSRVTGWVRRVTAPKPPR